jgi:hypothetical protein
VATKVPARQHSQLVIDEVEEVIDGALVTQAPALERSVDLIIAWVHRPLGADYAGSATLPPP